MLDTPADFQLLQTWPEACIPAHIMQNATYRQILPARDDDDEKPASGVYTRHLASAPTMAIPAVAPPPASLSVIRRIQVEHLGSPRRATANDVEPSFLINNSAPNATSYRFIAPRHGRGR